VTATHIVVAGLSASGKTTLVRRLREEPGVLVVPEHNDWIGGSDNFPKVPTTLDEKRAKQQFFLGIDLERQRWVTAHSEKARLIVSDADFTSPLAHNYAERWLIPAMNAYPWLVDTYGALLDRGELVPAHLYVYLDVSLQERQGRRQGDVDRRRNDMFFTEPFPTRMRRFYYTLMHPRSPAALLPSVWLDGDKAFDTVFARVREAITAHSDRLAEPTNMGRLLSALRATVADGPDTGS
jgi:deoxyadenosine/deoxycytidine kinase